MVPPKTSLIGWFTRAGRLKNEWARALADSDQANGLNRLRSVFAKLAADPVRFGRLWLSFLDTFLSPPRTRSLRESDFQVLRQIGDTASKQPSIGVRAADVWMRAVAAHDIRGESRQACQLLTRTYLDGATSATEKVRCALDL